MSPREYWFVTNGSWWSVICHSRNNGWSLGVVYGRLHDTPDDGLFCGTQGTMSHSLVPLFGSDVQLSDSCRKLNPDVGHMSPKEQWFVASCRWWSVSWHSRNNDPSLGVADGMLHVTQGTMVRYERSFMVCYMSPKKQWFVNRGRWWSVTCHPRNNYS